MALLITSICLPVPMSHVQGCSHQMQDMDHKTQSPKYKSHFYASGVFPDEKYNKKTTIFFRSISKIFNPFNADERSLKCQIKAAFI